MIRQEFTYICDECGREDAWSGKIYLHHDPAHPCLPCGWQEVDAKIICDIHTVTIDAPIGEGRR